MKIINKMHVADHLIIVFWCRCGPNCIAGCKRDWCIVLLILKHFLLYFIFFC